MINRVLIVNDNSLERMIVKSALSNTYSLEEAASGEEAFMLLEQYDFDVIILDNILEHETGYEIATQLRSDSRYEHIPLLLMSGNISPEDELKAFESGFSGYLPKTGRNEKILELIRQFEDKQLEEPQSVLVVDDSKVIRAMLSNTFRKEGFTVETAENGEKAIEKLKTYRPHFITMDVEMPGIDGFQTSKLIHTNPDTENIPIIIISSVDTVESHIKALEAGVSEYFVKPFEPVKLINYVKNVIINQNKRPDTKVLIVGKSKKSHHLLTYSLEKHSIASITVNRTADAMNKISHETIDLVIFDFDTEKNPPKFSSMKEMKAKIKELHLDVPIFVLTSVSNKNAILEAFRHGADDYLTSPVSEQELVIRIKTHLKKDIEEIKIEL